MINIDIPERASTCYHKEKQIAENKTMCLRCGRIRVILENGINLFFYCNGVDYLKILK